MNTGRHDVSENFRSEQYEKAASSNRKITEDELKAIVENAGKVHDAFEAVIRHENCLSQLCREKDIDYMKTRRIATLLVNMDKDILTGKKMFLDFNNAYEELYATLFGEECVEYIPADAEKNINFVFSTALNEREETVLRGRIFDRKTLQALSEELNITRERVRQIESKAMNKIKNPIFAKTLLYGVDYYNARVAETKRRKMEEIAKISCAKEAFTDYKKEENKYSNSIMDVKCRSVMSTRSCNCLERRGLRTIGDVCEYIDEYGEESLYKIRNIGKSSYDEIISHVNAAKNFKEERVS